MRTAWRRSRWRAWWAWPLLLSAAAAPQRGSAQSTPIELAAPVEPPPAAPPTAPAAAQVGPAGEPAGPPSPPELYLVLLAGTARHDTASVTATIHGFLGPDSSASAQVTLAPSTVLGLRAGFWGDGPARFFGLCADLQYLASSGVDSSTGARFEFDAFTTAVVPFLRVPFLPTDWAPTGAVDVYAGLSLGLVLANATVSDPALAHRVSDSAALGWSVGLLAGGSVRLWHVLLLGEVRRGPSHLKIGGGAWDFEEATSAMDSTTVVAGLGARF